MSRRGAIAANGVLMVLVCLSACQQQSPTIPPAKPSGRRRRNRRTGRSAVRFPSVDRYGSGDSTKRERGTGSSERSGSRRSPGSSVSFRYDTGRSSRRLMVEATGGGGGWVDFDRDGWYDLFLCQGGDPAAADLSTQPMDRLFPPPRSLGGARFVDVTVPAAVVEQQYGQGVAAADYDEDGFDDILVTNVGPESLFRNLGTARSRSGPPRRGSGAGRESSSRRLGRPRRRRGPRSLSVQLPGLRSPQPVALPQQHRRAGDLPSGGGSPLLGVLLQPGGRPLHGGGPRAGTDRPGDEAPWGSSSRTLTETDSPTSSWPTTRRQITSLRTGAEGASRRSRGRSAAPRTPSASTRPTWGLAFGDYDHSARGTSTSRTSRTTRTPCSAIPARPGSRTSRGGKDCTSRRFPYLGFGAVMADYDCNGEQDIFVANGHIDDWREVNGDMWHMPSLLFSYDGLGRWHDRTADAGPYLKLPRLDGRSPPRTSTRMATWTSRS